MPRQPPPALRKRASPPPADEPQPAETFEFPAGQAPSRVRAVAEFLLFGLILAVAGTGLWQLYAAILYG